VGAYISFPLHFLPPPLRGRVGVGAFYYPPPSPLPKWEGELIFLLPPPFRGRVGVGAYISFPLHFLPPPLRGRAGVGAFLLPSP